MNKGTNLKRAVGAEHDKSFSVVREQGDGIRMASKTSRKSWDLRLNLRDQK